MFHLSDDDMFDSYALGGVFAICLAVSITILAGIVGFIWWVAWHLL